MFQIRRRSGRWSSAPIAAPLPKAKTRSAASHLSAVICVVPPGPETTARGSTVKAMQPQSSIIAIELASHLTLRVPRGGRT